MDFIPKKTPSIKIVHSEDYVICLQLDISSVSNVEIP